MKKRLLLGPLVLSLGFASSVNANVVSDWNKLAVVYVATGGPGMPQNPPVGRTGPPGLLDLALIQAAVHDAVQAIEGRFEPYYYADPTKFGSGQPAAAVAAAAHRMLVLLYPSQAASLDAIYTTYLNTNGLAGDPGLAAGEAAAAALFTQYRPTLAVTPFFGRNATGEWRSATALTFQFLAVSQPFTLTRIDQFRPEPPPPLTSTRYAREFDEAKALGNTTAHPNSRTDQARFWSGNYVSMWNEALQRIAENNVPDVGESARLLALANLAAADAAMAIWESKYFYNFWRPITAIQEGATDGNAKTDGDLAWTPLFATPNYPDYVSGANGLTGAFTGAMRLFFGGDDLNFSVKTTATSAIDKERWFTSIAAAAEEVVDARILMGIHFRAADEEGRELGQRVALWVFQKFLRPLPPGQRP